MTGIDKPILEENSAEKRSGLSFEEIKAKWAPILNDTTDMTDYRNEAIRHRKVTAVLL